MPREGHIPAESEATRDLVGVEVPAHCFFPDGDREGRELEWFLEAIHIGCKAGLAETTSNTIHVITLDLRTRSFVEVVTLAGLTWVGGVLGGIELEAKSLFEDHVVDPLDGTGVVRIGSVVRGLQPFVDVVVRCEEMVEWDKFLSEGVERGMRPG